MPQDMDIHRAVQELPTQGAAGESLETLGQAYITALTTQDLESLKTLFGPHLRFRALVPRRLCEGQTAVEAIDWLRRWFGEADEVEVLQSSVAQVFDRLNLSYRLRVHDVINGWRVIEQYAYGDVQDNHIVDLWLLCSGFRPDTRKELDAK
jgi:hypothetical protein